MALTSVNIYFGTYRLSVQVPFDALVFTSDLQSLVLQDPETREPVTELFSTLSLAEFHQFEEEGLIQSIPVGTVIPEILAHLLQDRGISPDHVLVLLCGDLTGTPDRGSNREVTEVWTAFERVFENVVGVLGSHDLLPASAPFRVLDGNVVSFGKFRIGGVSGIIGRPSKPNRKAPPTYRSLLQQVLKKRPHVLLLHECPQVPASSLPGNADLAAWLRQSSAETLICAGHVPWEPLTASLPPHLVLNVEHRVVALTAPKS